MKREQVQRRAWRRLSLCFKWLVKSKAFLRLLRFMLAVYGLTMHSKLAGGRANTATTRNSHPLKPLVAWDHRLSLLVEAGTIKPTHSVRQLCYPFRRSWRSHNNRRQCQRICMDWIFMPSPTTKFICWSLILTVKVLGVRAFEVIRSREWSPL